MRDGLPNRRKRKVVWVYDKAPISLEQQLYREHSSQMGTVFVDTVSTFRLFFPTFCPKSRKYAYYHEAESKIV